MSEIRVYQTPGGEEPDDVAFADVEEVARRMGRVSVPFTDDETAQVESLLTQAAASIAAACGKDEPWAAALDPVPPALRTTSIEMVTRVMQNPQGARSTSETLGSHSRSASFADASAVLELTPAEETRCRRAVFKSSIGSVPAGSILDTMGDAIGGGSALRDGVTVVETP